MSAHDILTPMSTTIPKGYRPERFLAWCRWMRIYRRTYVSAFAKR